MDIKRGLADNCEVVKMNELKIGQPFQGGIYVGDIIENDLSSYPLILAPKELGISYNPLQWKIYLGDSPEETKSTVNGYRATRAMVRENKKSRKIIYPAAQYCYDSCINGYEDWYLPAQEELLIIREAAKNHELGIMDNNKYWSSSETSSDMASAIFMSKQEVSYVETGILKTNRYYVCAVRRGT